MQARYEVRVIVDLHDDHALTPVARLIRVLKNIQNVAAFNMENDVLKGYATLSFQLLILRDIPREVLQAQA